MSNTGMGFILFPAPFPTPPRREGEAWIEGEEWSLDPIWCWGPDQFNPMCYATRTTQTYAERVAAEQALATQAAQTATTEKEAVQAAAQAGIAQAQGDEVRETVRTGLWSMAPLIGAFLVVGAGIGGYFWWRSRQRRGPAGMSDEELEQAIYERAIEEGVTG